MDVLGKRRWEAPPSWRCFVLAIALHGVTFPCSTCNSDRWYRGIHNLSAWVSSWRSCFSGGDGDLFLCGRPFKSQHLGLAAHQPRFAIGFTTILPHRERCEAGHQASCGRRNESPIVILCQESHISLSFHYMANDCCKGIPLADLRSR